MCACVRRISIFMWLHMLVLLFVSRICISFFYLFFVYLCNATLRENFHQKIESVKCIEKMESFNLHFVLSVARVFSVLEIDYRELADERAAAWRLVGA